MYEETRRQIARDVNGLWYYIKSRLPKIIQDTPSERHKSTLQIILDDVADRWRVIIRDLHVLTENDGFRKWREQESQQLSNSIQNRFQVRLFAHSLSISQYSVSSIQYPESRTKNPVSSIYYPLSISIVCMLVNLNTK